MNDDAEPDQTCKSFSGGVYLFKKFINGKSRGGGYAVIHRSGTYK